MHHCCYQHCSHLYCQPASRLKTEGWKSWKNIIPREEVYMQKNSRSNFKNCNIMLCRVHSRVIVVSQSAGGSWHVHTMCFRCSGKGKKGPETRKNQNLEGSQDGALKMQAFLVSSYFYTRTRPLKCRGFI